MPKGRTREKRPLTKHRGLLGASFRPAALAVSEARPWVAPVAYC